MTSIGVVSQWQAEDGWGVIRSPDTPGGCWVHFSTIAGTGSGLRSLHLGETVSFDWEAADQDGYAFRAVAVTGPAGGWDSDAPTAEGRKAYGSTLTITYDGEDQA